MSEKIKIRIIKKTKNPFFSALATGLVIAGVFCSIVFTSAYYSPGETTNPTCSPTDSGCDVTASASYSFSTNNFSGTGNFVTTGAGSFGSLEVTGDTALAVGSGGTGLGTISAGSILAANSLNTLSAVNSTSGTTYLKNVDGTISWDTLSIPTNYFSRASTTISPATAGDTLDMGTGAITTTGTGTFDHIVETTPTLQLLSGKNQANGYAGLDENGDLIITGIIPKYDTAANLALVVLDAGEIATTSDTHRLLQGDGATAGGLDVIDEALNDTLVTIGTPAVASANIGYGADGDLEYNARFTYPNYMNYFAEPYLYLNAQNAVAGEYYPIYFVPGEDYDNWYINEEGYFSGSVQTARTLITFDDSVSSFGNSQIFRMTSETTGNDNMQFGLTLNSASASGYLSIMEAGDMGNANRSPLALSANPVLRIYSADDDQALDYVEFYHNQTNAIINWGNGNLNVLDSKAMSFGTDNDFQIYHSGTEAVMLNNTGALSILGSGSGITIGSDGDTVSLEGTTKFGNGTGVSAAATEGVLTLAGLKTAGNNENLSIDFETTADTVALSSTTGVGTLSLGSIGLNIGGTSGINITKIDDSKIKLAGTTGYAETLTLDLDSSTSNVVNVGTDSGVSQIVFSSINSFGFDNGTYFGKYGVYYTVGNNVTFQQYDNSSYVTPMIIYREGTVANTLILKTGNVGIGIAAPTSPLHVDSTTTGTEVTIDGVVNSTSYAFGNKVLTEVNSTTNHVYGWYNNPTLTPPTGKIAANFSLAGTAVAGDGLTITARQLDVGVMSKSGTGTVSDVYGIYIGAQTIGTNNYGIYQSGSNINYFGGTVGINTTAPDRKFEINTGAATGGMRLTYNDANGSATIYSDMLIDANGDLAITATGGDIILSENTTIGTGEAGVDYVLNFNGETSDGSLTWMEDEYTFSFLGSVGIPDDSSLSWLNTFSSIRYSSGDGILYINSEAGIEITPAEGTVTVSGDLYVTGKITGAGGIDPPYMLFDLQTREDIVQLVNEKVPLEKRTGATMFFNSTTNQMEIFVASEGKFYDLSGNLLGQGEALDTIVDGEITNLNNSGSVGSGNVSGVSSSLSIKTALELLGMNLSKGVASLTEVIADKISVKTASVETLQMVDKSTGEIYCTYIENGEWKKVAGGCGSAEVVEIIETGNTPAQESEIVQQAIEAADAAAQAASEAQAAAEAAQYAAESAQQTVEQVQQTPVEPEPEPEVSNEEESLEVSEVPEVISEVSEEENESPEFEALENPVIEIIEEIPSVGEMIHDLTSSFLNGILNFLRQITGTEIKKISSSPIVINFTSALSNGFQQIGKDISSLKSESIHAAGLLNPVLDLFNR